MDRSMLFGDSLAIWLVMALLGTMSLLSWYIALYRGLVLWRARRAIAFDAARLAATPDRAVGALHLRGAHPVATRVADAGDRELARLRALPTAERPPECPERPVQRALHEAAAIELHRLASGLPVLGTCAATAPLLGLFGTVWGIAHTFLAAHRSGSATLAALAPGVAEALVTTIAGLVVAIPATLFHNTLQRQHGAVELHLGTLVAALLNRLPASLPPPGRSAHDTTPSRSLPTGPEA